MRSFATACTLIALALAGCGSRSAVPGAGDNWSAPSGDTAHSRYSRLTDINAATVGRLGLAWSKDLGTNRGLEATPVVIDGVMYTSGVLGRAYAFDAATGKAIWAFEPTVDMQVNRAACCDQVNRGVAVANGRVFVAALDGKLYALDAKTGAVAWSADTVVDHRRGYSSTGAPEVAGDVVIIGNGGADADARGYVTAYDVNSGRQRWRFFMAPSDPKLGPQASPELEAAVKTWDRNSRWDVGGGGAPWDAITYDPRFGTVYIGVGNAEPEHKRARSPAGGDNLYTSSIVAIDPKSGRMKWYFQETPGDSWDYDETQPMVLTDLVIKGQRTPVLLHAPKNGFLFVIDRRTGKLIDAPALVPTNWASGFDLATGRAKLTPERSDYFSGPKIVFPSTPGARNWQPPAFDPQTGLLYASILDMGNLIFIPPGPKPYRARALNNGTALIFGPDIVDTLPSLPPPLRAAVEALPEMQRIRAKPYTSELRAIDPHTGKTVWAAPMSGWQDRGGAMATAGGLVFQGRLDGRLNAYDARTVALLKSIDTGVAIMAAPMTYRVGGVQYVAVMAGWGGGGWPYVPPYSATAKYGPLNRILVFRLDGGPVKLPDPLPPLEVAPPPPPQLAGTDAAMIAHGRELFYGNCGICHSNQPRSHSPDLRRLDAGTHAQFQQIVRGGLLLPAGMPRWDDLLTASDVDAIHAWLIDQQTKTRARELALKRAGLPLDSKSAAILSSF
ncbi:MAG TPA: PQQ-dependent dehydrogenase, methanol/ethanol family [Caulobacteraceae bacterium]